jgi:UDP-N-acetylmuramate--alanine ligase
LSFSDLPEFKPGPDTWLHFVGVGGSGMSGLAQFHAQAGGTTTGSDRAFDQGERQEIRTRLEDLGIGILPQDGNFPGAAEPGGQCPGQTCTAVVVSTAVENKVGDIATARKLGIPVWHRSELLARHVSDHRTIAVSGTSGKSTVTAMVFTILRACGKGPGLLTGGPLVDLVNERLIGNAWAPDVPEAGTDRPYLVIEADESDGSLVRYRPWAGIILNLGLDHKSPDEVLDMFRIFKDQTTGPVVVGAETNLASVASGAELFGLGEDDRHGTWAREVSLQPEGSGFKVEDVAFTLPVAGRFNVLNAVAAIAACRACGIALEAMVAPLAGFAGVARRFVRVGTAAGVEVIDDFAHNPDKIAAALGAAHRRVVGARGRVLAVFQPHGFGPTRFLRQALTEAFASGLEPDDVLWLPEIYFAGGTVTRDISSGDLCEDIRNLGRDARFLAARQDLPAAIAAAALPGDLVLVMGARDPSLTDFCRTVLEELGKKPG